MLIGEKYLLDEGECFKKIKFIQALLCLFALKAVSLFRISLGSYKKCSGL